MKYVLITPARNEEALIRKALDSVTSQTLPPLKWFVVDDGSKDRTAAIVEEYASRFPWIELVRQPERVDRSFAGKVLAFNAGFERAQGLPYDVVGNLDADISFPPDYMEFLMKKFDEDPELGVGGTPFTEDEGYDTARDSFEGENYVAGGVQLFRARCFQDVGGYIPIPAGGIDWIAVMSARMKGWKVRSFAEKRFHHYRALGTAEMSPLVATFDYGRRAYSLGSSPIWQFLRCMYRMKRKPYVLAGLSLGAGYFTSMVLRTKRAVTPEMIRFYRREQMQKLRWIFQSLFSFKKVDNFSLNASHKTRRSKWQILL
jgi:glycosyltransferase involved in cell wall biosynthesis